MKKLISLLLILVSIAYPLLVYAGVENLGPAFFALLLAVMGVAKFIAERKARIASARSNWWILFLVLAYSLGIVITNNSLLLRLYPVNISMGMAYLFASSLKAP